MGSLNAFDFPLADLSPAQQASLGAALQRESIQHQWVGTTLQVDMAYEARVSTLVDQARGGVLPAAPAGTAPGPAPTMPGPSGYGTATSSAPGFGTPGPSYPPAAYPSTPYPQPGYAPTGYGYAAAPRTNGMAIASLVLGVCSIVLCGGLVLGVPAVICGHIARGQIRDSDGTEQGDGMALAGLITGWISTGLSIAAIVLWIVVVVIAAGSSSY